MGHNNMCMQLLISLHTCIYLQYIHLAKDITSQTLLYGTLDSRQRCADLGRHHKHQQQHWKVIHDSQHPRDVVSKGDGFPAVIIGDVIEGLHSAVVSCHSVTEQQDHQQTQCDTLQDVGQDIFVGKGVGVQTEIHRDKKCRAKLQCTRTRISEERNQLKVGLHVCTTHPPPCHE